MNVALEKARDEDIKDITDLINTAYRGEVGWTKETALISGDRVCEEQIQGLIKDQSIHFLVSYNLGDLLCCICIEHSKQAANFGFFAVNPKLQGLGIGKSVLKQSEIYASSVLKVKKYALQVVSQRPELVDFYIRRGYKQTGLVKPFPVHLNVGMPKQQGVTIDYLEKKV